MAAPESAPSRAEVAAELARIAASDLFANAGRLAPFLRHVVETTLDGRSTELKESTVGVSVFGRAPDYDPRTDPIVRVEARRLRSRLADYYAGPGADDAVGIDLPKGTYVPVFTLRKCTLAAAPGTPPRWRFWAAGVTGVLAVAIALWLLAWRPREANTASVAVFPFVNVTGDPANEYFADGLTDELIDSLSRVPGLKVVGRSLVFRQKGKSYDVQALGREWGVGAAVEGSVRRSGERIRITAQLTNTRDGYNVWSQTYDRAAGDAFAVQQEIGESVARALRVRLAPGRGGAAPRNPEAYRKLLEARYQFGRFSSEGLRGAIRTLQEAIAMQPDYAAAHTMLSKVYGMAGYYYVEPPAAAWAKAREYADKALALDSELGEAHAMRGFVLGLHEWRWAESEAAFRRALELDPASSEVHGAYATACLMPQARLTEAVAEYKRSMELDPLQIFANMGAAFALLSMKKYDEALTHYDRALALISTFEDLWWDKGMCLALMGRGRAALEAFRKAAETDGRRDTGPDTLALALLGDVEAARRRLPGWEREARGEDVINVARVYGVLGDSKNAVAWLEKAWAIREPQLVWLKVDPRFEKVRGTAEFQAILRRMGL